MVRGHLQTRPRLRFGHYACTRLAKVEFAMHWGVHSTRRKKRSGARHGDD
jgi:hypothetical protein